MKLSIIIPAYNEERTIQEILRRVNAVDLGFLEKEIIVVDDGSKDRTRKILKTIPGIFYIFHEKNLGKGGAMKTGINASTGDIIIFQDADLEYDPRDYFAMVEPILKGKTKITNGVRVQPKKDARRKKSLYWISWLGNQAITWITNFLYLHYSKEYEGCYKAFTRDVLIDITVETNNFDFDNELLCKALKRGYRIVDIPIHYYPRSYEEGKKINWRHGLLIIWTILKCRFTSI